MNKDDYNKWIRGLVDNAKTGPKIIWHRIGSVKGEVIKKEGNVTHVRFKDRDITAS